jgi:RNA polymerase sigma-70 factor (ECF subfamily)
MDYRSASVDELARICSDAGSRDAWNEFVRRLQRPIALVVLRTARMWGVTSTALLDDLVQETFLRLCAHECRLLKNFVPREPDSVIGYVKVIAANVTRDHLRSETSQKRGGHQNLVESERESHDFEFAAPGQTEVADKALQMQEIDRTIQSFVPHTLTERDRTIFWLYFEQGFSARDISAITSIGLSVKGVESSIHRTTKQVREVLLPLSDDAKAKGFSGLPTIIKENG